MQTNPERRLNVPIPEELYLQVKSASVLSRLRMPAFVALLLTLGLAEYRRQQQEGQTSS